VIFSLKDTLIPGFMNILIQNYGDIMRNFPALNFSIGIFFVIAVMISPVTASGALPVNSLPEHGSDLSTGDSNDSQDEDLVPSLVINNVSVTGNATLYLVTGDVSNAGTGVAKDITVVMERPAVPTEPCMKYSIGILNPADFSSFEVSFTIPAENETASLLVTYTDADRKPFHTRTNVTVPGTS